MTPQERKVMEMALEALEYHTAQTRPIHQTSEAITAIKEALAQPEQEPVAWITPDGEGFRIRFSPPVNDVPLGWDALYTTPPQRAWVGLTDEEAIQMHIDCNSVSELFDAIDAKLKYKNTKGQE